MLKKGPGTDFFLKGLKRQSPNSKVAFKMILIQPKRIKTLPDDVVLTSQDESITRRKSRLKLFPSLLKSRNNEHELAILLQYFELSKAYFISKRAVVLKKLEDQLKETESIFLRVFNAIKLKRSSDLLKSSKQLLSQVGYLNSYAMLRQSFLLNISVLLMLKESHSCNDIANQLKAIARWNNDFDTEMNVYGFKGRCYELEQQFERALICYSKMLSFALILRNIDIELKAYDQIGLMFYYLNDIMTATYYHNRGLNGIIETNDSPYRSIKIPRIETRMGYHLYLESFSGYISIPCRSPVDLTILAKEQKIFKTDISDIHKEVRAYAKLYIRSVI